MRSKSHGDESPHPRAKAHENGSSESSKRSPNGRFASPHSGNPKGRPPKPKEHLAPMLQRILDEQLPSEVDGSMQSVGETLLRQTLVHAMKQPRIALELLKLCLGDLGRPVAATPDDETDDRRQAILSDYVERQSRRNKAFDPKITIDESEEADR